MKKFVLWFTGSIEGIVEKHQATSVVYFLLLVMISCIILKPIADSNNSQFPFLTTTILVAILLVVYKFTKSSLLVGNLTTAVIYAAIFNLIFKSGGLYSNDLSGLFIIPMLALNVAGKKSGIIWACLCLIPIFYHFYLALDPIQNALYREQTLAFQREYYLHINLTLLVLPMSLVLLFLRLNGSLLKELESKNKEFDYTNATLASQTEQLTNTKNKLQESNKLLKKYAHATSHDLKQPVRTIVSFTQLLKRELQNENNDKEKVSAYLNQIEEGSTRMNTQIVEILNFSNQPNIDIDTQIDLNEIIKQVITDLTHQIGDQKIQFTIAELPKVSGLNSNIYKIFQNLISNAIKYKDPSKDLVINIYGSENKELYTFSIKDNGVGIPTNKLDKIFDKGIQLDSNVEGGGIGLDTVKVFVEKKGGKLWVESELGKGSTFYFTCPKNKA